MPETIDAMTEMDNSDDRTCAVVGIAFLENNLVLAIIARLRVLSETEQKSLFDEPQSLLCGFSNKIDMGWVLNLFGDNIKTDLLNLNRIRNRFAHYLEVRNFDHSEVASLCDALICPNYLDQSPGRTISRTRREKYTDTIAYLASRFSIETKQTHRPPEPITRLRDDY